MHTLNKSLRCLGHPLSLLSLGVLLLNDHLLKWAAPSWLTGKLSDVAGLFFFPFLMAALLSLPAERLRVPARRVGPAAFVITALWFTSIKTVPAVNALTERLVTALVGLPAQIVPDPTDLLALPVLMSGWWLWSRVKAGPPLRRDWLALGVAALVTVATSCAVPARVLDRVVEVDGVLYVRARDEWIYRSLGEQSAERWYARSKDGGLTWSKTQNPPPEMDTDAALSQTVCAQSDPMICYGIVSREEQIDVSFDGGETWQVAWTIPYGRDEYRRRALKGWFPCRFSPWPRDLILVERDEIYVIAAMGSEGVLRLMPDGQWTRQDVLDTELTAFGGDLSVVHQESTILAVMGVLTAFMLQDMVCWVILKRHRPRVPLWESLWWAIKPTIIGAGIAIGPAVLILFFYNSLSFLIVFTIPISLIALLFGSMTSGMHVQPIVSRPARVWAAIVGGLAVGLVVWRLGLASYTRWALGEIVLYSTARQTSILVVLVSLIFGTMGVYFLARWAGDPSSAAKTEMPGRDNRGRAGF